jgi:hypothetical protein
MSIWNTYARRKIIQRAMANWLAKLPCEWFVTLNFNRDATFNQVRHKFGKWLQRIDRQILGRNYARRGNDRTIAVGIHENLNSNAHIHMLLKFPESARNLSKRKLRKISKTAWTKIVRSGKVDFQRARNNNIVARYISKGTSDPKAYSQIMLSSEFHNR